MILIACVDVNNGMLFNNRRQSRDKVLMEHIIELIFNKRLWINNFSKDIFENYKLDNLIIDDDFSNKIEKEDFCFVENISIKELEDKIEKVVLYNWNRNYPADVYFDLPLEKWICESEKEFTGNSHDKITEKIYKRREE